MQQSSVTDYFKAKKRGRDDSVTSALAKAKVKAVISSTGRDGPSPIRANESSSSENEIESDVVVKPPVVKPVENNARATTAPAAAAEAEPRKTTTPRRLTATPTAPTTPKKAVPAAAVSPSPIHAISPSKFFSPSRQRDIFSSPVKLTEIHNPSPSKLILSPFRKRLFCATTPGDGAAAAAKAGGEPSKKISALNAKFQHLVEQEPKLGPEASASATISQPAVTTTPEVAPLQLPPKYKIIQELFEAVEAAIPFVSKNNSLTFKKVKEFTLKQKLGRRTALTEKHLGQMHTVFPGCYTFSYEKVKEEGSFHPATKQLVIKVPGMDGGNATHATFWTQRVERLRIFRANILKIAQAHHRKFLSSMRPPIEIHENKVVTRWHPKFDLNVVPDIEATGLPEASCAPKIITGRDILAMAQTMYENSGVGKKALEKLQHLQQFKARQSQPAVGTSVAAAAAPPSTSAATARVQQQNNKNAKKTISALIGVNAGLLERIRAKEQANCVRAMTLTPAETKEKAMLTRLPDMVTKLYYTMVEEKKPALSLDFVVERLGHSLHGSLSPADVQSHVRLLTRILPTFAEIKMFSEGEYVMVDRGVDTNDLQEYLRDRIRKFDDGSFRSIL